MEVMHHVSLVTEWIRRAGLLATGGMAVAALCEAPEGTSLSRLVVVVAEFTDENLTLVKVRHQASMQSTRLKYYVFTYG